MLTEALSLPPLCLTHTDMGLLVCLLEEALTDALPRVSGEAGAVVALQSSLAVAGKHLSTALTSLPRTHLAAPAAIQHQRDSCGTLGDRTGATAGPVTQLAQHLQGKYTGTSWRLEQAKRLNPHHCSLCYEKHCYHHHHSYHHHLNDYPLDYIFILCEGVVKILLVFSKAAHQNSALSGQITVFNYMYLINSKHRPDLLDKPNLT